MRENSKKPVRGVYASQDWSPEKALTKRIQFYKRKCLHEHPQIATKWVQSLKNLIVGYFFKFLQRGLKQNSINQKVKVAFLPKMALKVTTSPQCNVLLCTFITPRVLRYIDKQSDMETEMVNFFRITLFPIVFLKRMSPMHPSFTFKLILL